MAPTLRPELRREGGESRPGREDGEEEEVLDGSSDSQ